MSRWTQPELDAIAATTSYEKWAEAVGGHPHTFDSWEVKRRRVAKAGGPVVAAVPVLLRATCHPDRPHRAKGLCLQCYRAEYFRQNRERLVVGMRDAHLQRSYGLSIEQRDAMIRAQGGLCAICGRLPSGPAGNAILHVDHDHVTGRIRGMLCTDCNRAIGLLNEDPKSLLAAIGYLSSFRS